MNITDRLLEYIQGITYKDLPAEIVAAGRRSVMDTLGVITAGSNRPGSREIAQLVGEWGGRPESTLLIYGGKVPALQAVLANSTMARALDFDDCHVYNRVHPSATVVPVALAAYTAAGISGSPPMKTGLMSVRVGSVLFVMPFFFVVNPTLLLQGTWLEILRDIPTAVIGAICWASGMEGYLIKVGKLTIPARVMLIISGTLLILPGWFTAITGIGIAIGGVFITKLLAKRGKA